MRTPTLALAATALVAPSTALAAAPESPVLELQSVSTNAVSSEAIFHVVINPAGGGEVGATYELLYAKGASCEGEATASAGIATGAPEEFTATVAGLLPNVEYTACTVLVNGANEKASSPLVPFLPPPGAETRPATEVLSTSAKLEGTLQTTSGDVEYWFAYNVGPHCTGTTGKLVPEPPEPGEGNVSHELTGLLPGTEYTYCLVGRNAGGETVGAPRSFTTEAVPPTITEEASVLSVSATGARLVAQVDPGGVDTKYRFEYDTSEYPAGSPAHGQSVAGDAGEGAVPQTIETDVQGLSPATVYNFRVVLESGKGEAQGKDQRFTTQATGTFSLPDGREWELVSPSNKHGALILPLTEKGGLIQAAADGGAFTYVARAPAEEQPAGSRSPDDTQLYSTRTSTGWATRDITTPNEEVALVKGGRPAEYYFFSEDLSAGIVEPQSATALSLLTTERTPYLAQPGPGECTGRPPIVPSDTCYQPLVTATNVPAGTKFGGEEEPEPLLPGEFKNGVNFLTATPDLSHVVLESPQVLAGGFKPGFSSKITSLYELSGTSANQPGTLETVSLIPPAGAGQCGGTGPVCEPAAEAELKTEVGYERDMRGTISPDGDRVVFRGAVNTAHLYVRDLRLDQTMQLDVPQEGAPNGGEGPAEFQVAATEGATTKVFFTDKEQLTADPPAQTEGRDLYMCEVLVSPAGKLECKLSDLSVDVNPGERAEVAGTSGQLGAIDGSGRFVYFVAGGVLTSEPNARGETAQPGNCHTAEEASCNMYVYDTVSRHIGLVAVLSSADKPDWGEAAGNGASVGSLTAGSSPDGRYFAFMSDRPLTGYDNADVNEQEVIPGEGKKHADEEVFLYDSQTGGLSCVSCNPSGARPRGVFDRQQIPPILVDNPGGWQEKWLAGSIPGWTLLGGSLAALRQPRYVFDSGRVVFDSADGLVGQDANGVEDVYEFEPPKVGNCEESTSSGSQAYIPSEDGCVALISSGTSSEESAFLDASEGHGEGEHGEPGQEGGDNVFFLTSARLSPLDVDSASDVYDAHVCGAGGPCPVASSTAAVCEGDACQAVVAPPSELTPGSLTFSGPGNLTPSPPAPAKPKTATQIRAEKLIKALKACRKDKRKKKRQACDKQAKKQYGAAHRATKTNRTAK